MSHTNTHYVILDTRGLLLHSYHRSTRKTIETTDGFIPSWEDGIAEFVEAYLDPILSSVAPRQVLACFDGGNTARRLLYFDYKAKRGQRDKDENPIRTEQVKLLMEKGQRLLAYLGCRTVRVPGEEADDLIGLLVSRLEADHFTIYTRDKDLLQLVSDKVMVVQNGTLFAGPDVVGSENNLDGTPFDLIALMKAIVGDSSDEYPGVKGCGPKFFETLLQTYGADALRQLRNMIETWNHPKGVKPQSNGCKLMDKLIENWDDLLLFYKVAKINPANCYGANNGKRKNPEWYVRVPDGKKVHEILGPIGISRPQWDRFFPTEKLIDANRADQMQDIAGQILASPIVSYDFETSDKLQHKPFREYDKNFVDVLSQELTSISINYGDNLQHTIYIPFDHKDTANLTPEWARWILQVLANVQPRAVVQNAAFELSVALTQLQEARRAPFDTAIMSMYVDENEENHLKGMSKLWLNYTQATYKEVTQGRAMHELTAQEALSYGCDDSLVTGHLFDLFRHIMQLEGSWAFYAENEVDWALDSAHYFVEGTDVDYQTLHTFHTEAKKKVAEGMEQMHASLAEHCNAQKTAEVVQPLATTLLDEWWSLEGGKYGEDITKAEAARQRLWEQAWNGCFYVPPSRTVEIKFSPTPVQLTAVASLIDKAIPRIDKVTQKAIEEWDIAVSDALEVAEKSRVVEPLAHEFHEALFRARKSLKKADSVEYRELSNLCLKVLRERGNMKATLSGDQLNTNSPKQMQQLLYGKLELPIRRRSKVQQGSSRAKLGLQGGPATGIKAIAAARVYDVTRDDDWRVGVLEAYHSVAKTSQEISLYYETYPLMVHPRTGKIHPQIKNCGTVTRRPSGSAPNVLQVAKGPLRTLFRAGDYGDGERVTISADFASQEILLLACESRDPVMLKAFTSDPRLDLHSMTASGFAHIVMSRLGLDIASAPDYDTFYGWLHQKEDEALAKAAKTTRNKYAKACIAEGSLVLTNEGLVPIEDVTLSHLVWDGVEWVSHEGVICKGVQEVITYEGLTATRDHQVFLETGEKVTFEGAFRGGKTLAIGEDKEKPVAYVSSGSADIYSRRLVKSSRMGNLLCMWGQIAKKIEQHIQRRCVHLYPVQTSMFFSSRQASNVKVFGDEVEMYKTGSDRLSVLRAEGDRTAIQKLPGVLDLCERASAPRDLSKSGDRSYRQFRPLRAWELATGFSPAKLWKHAKERIRGLLRNRSGAVPCLAPAGNGFSWVPFQGDYNKQVSDKGGYGTGDPLHEKTSNKKMVYDIVNAGPRHRFTVSGKIVANCNFGIAYGAGPTTLAENLLIDLEFAKELMNGVFTLYQRIQPWQEETVEFAKRHGYTLTAYGNRRHAPKDLWSSEKGLAGRAARQVTNAVIQSTAADILKVVLTDMNRREMRQRYRLKALRPVYDEITASVPVELAADYAQELIEVMSVTPPGYPVGMKVDLSLGKTWGSVIEVEDTSRAGIEQALETVLK